MSCMMMFVYGLKVREGTTLVHYGMIKYIVIIKLILGSMFSELRFGPEEKPMKLLNSPKVWMDRPNQTRLRPGPI